VTQARTAGNVCYRHPDRQSFILCQRCGRTICPQCQTQAAVGVHCPECVREARASAPRAQPTIVTALRRQGAPVVTYAIIALCIAVFLVQLVTTYLVPSAGNAFAAYFAVYQPPFTAVVPWTMITSTFSHSTAFPFLHILFNMFSLFIFGPILERMLGRLRFLALYLLSGFGGSVAVLLIAPDTRVLGASGAIFGLLGAFFVIQRRLGFRNPQLLLLVGLNLAIGFIPGMSISWQAHVGGLVVGAAIALIYFLTRRESQRGAQAVAVVGTALLLVASAVVRVALG
jgi:membrane associated rhomboid family serine protease